MKTTTTRIHLGMAVSDLARSITFYRDLFGVEPVKIRSDWAKFSVAEPAVNFTLQVTNTSPKKGPRQVTHFGIELTDATRLDVERDRLVGLGHGVREEKQTLCCYALQDKFWVEDPDGNSWEFFHVLDANPVPAATDAGCSTAACCTS